MCCCCLIRPDNGCQLMALLGWVPGGALSAASSAASSAPANGSSSSSHAQQQQPAFLEDVRQPRFVHNASGRFECRWAIVRIEPSPSVLLKVHLG